MIHLVKSALIQYRLTLCISLCHQNISGVVNKMLFCSIAMAMGTGSDIREILELDTGTQDEFITKDALFSDGKKVLASLFAIIVGFVCVAI